MKLAMVGVLAVLSGCSTLGAPSVRVPEPYTAKGVRVEVSGLYRDGWGNVVGVAGEAVNETESSLGVCTIGLEAVDDSGAKVADAVAFTNSLGPGQRWKFQAVFTAPFESSFREIRPGNVTALTQTTLTARAKKQ